MSATNIKEEKGATTQSTNLQEMHPQQASIDTHTFESNTTGKAKAKHDNYTPPTGSDQTDLKHNVPFISNIEVKIGSARPHTANNMSQPTPLIRTDSTDNKFAPSSYPIHNKKPQEVNPQSQNVSPPHDEPYNGPRETAHIACQVPITSKETIADRGTLEENTSEKPVEMDVEETGLDIEKNEGGEEPMEITQFTPAIIKTTGEQSNENKPATEKQPVETVLIRTSPTSHDGSDTSFTGMASPETSNSRTSSQNLTTEQAERITIGDEKADGSSNETILDGFVMINRSDVKVQAVVPQHQQPELKHRDHQQLTSEAKSTACKEVPNSKPGEEIPCVLIIGKTGNGKSSLGNILLGEEHFKVGRGMSSTTMTAEHAVSSKARIYCLKVVDTPDVSGTPISHAARQEEFQRWRQLTSPAPHAVLLAVRCDVRYTPEEFQIYQQLKHMIGLNMTSRLIVAFTFGDRLDRPIETDLKLAGPELLDVLSDAENRHVVFNKKAKPEQMSTSLQELRTLMDRIGKPSQPESGTASPPPVRLLASQEAPEKETIQHTENSDSYFWCHIV